VPASFFGIVLGLAGLGGAWRAAARVWHLPVAVGEALMLAAGVVWALMLALDLEAGFVRVQPGDGTFSSPPLSEREHIPRE